MEKLINGQYLLTKDGRKIGNCKLIGLVAEVGYITRDGVVLKLTYYEVKTEGGCTRTYNREDLDDLFYFTTEDGTTLMWIDPA